LRRKIAGWLRGLLDASCRFRDATRQAVCVVPPGWQSSPRFFQSIDSAVPRSPRRLACSLGIPQRNSAAIEERSVSWSDKGVCREEFKREAGATQIVGQLGWGHRLDQGGLGWTGFDWVGLSRTSPTGRTGQTLREAFGRPSRGCFTRQPVNLRVSKHLQKFDPSGYPSEGVRQPVRNSILSPRARRRRVPWSCFALRPEAVGRHRFLQQCFLREVVFIHNAGFALEHAPGFPRSTANQDHLARYRVVVFYFPVDLRFDVNAKVRNAGAVPLIEDAALDDIILGDETPAMSSK